MENSRRDLLKLAGLAFVGQVSDLPMRAQPAAKSVAEMPFTGKENVRLGVIGTGGRGTSLVDNFSSVPGVSITALCDIVKEKVQRAQTRLDRAGKASQKISTYTEGDHAFEQLVKQDDLDLVVIATPWVWHTPMAVAAMKAGKHVAVEVPAARTLDECWELVNTSEATRRHCIQLENCCYGYNEMMVLNMVRAGLFGDLTHGGAAYNHDLRSILFSPNGEGQWRRFEHLNRNGNLYPTHGLGPVAHYMDINRGDRFDTLVSMSSISGGLQQYRKDKLPADDPRQKEVYKEGDFNVSLIRTVKGRVIELEHNVSSPQPYDRINLIAGTKGIFRDYPPRVYFDGAPREEFTSLDAYKAQYEPALWKKIGEMAKELGGHGGMDFVMAYRLIECVKQGLPPEIDVYDAAAWSAPGPLSEASIAQGSAPQKFPDFTRGRWESRPRV
ncbi:MAG TPA: Gfo/Idh/MocA family oxidoreductase [Candidatus Acidoferrales bacterium]|nr:Gfo/Idh/MocA family oxidoreductase [Candidatus Acidoferrales bacterium]